LGSVRKSYTPSGVFLTSNSPPNLIAITSHPLHILRGQLDRFEHVLISRAAAGVPSDGFADIFFTRLFVAGEWLRSEEHTSELQSRGHLVCRLLLEKKKHIK